MGRKRLAKNRTFPPNLYQNSAGYYYYLHPHSKTTKGLGRDKAFAFQEARGANVALQNIQRPKLAEWAMGLKEHTLADWLPEYKKLWIDKSKKPPAAATLRSCTMYLKKIASAKFSWMRLPEVTTAHIAEFLREVEKLSGAPTALLLRSRFSDVYRMAETQGLIQAGKNPVTATYTPGRDVARERLTLEQFWLIHSKASTWMQKAMCLALLTAQRRDDLANLQFSDFKDGFLHVVQGKGSGTMRLRLNGNTRLEIVNMSISEAVSKCRDLIVTRYMIHHVEHAGSAKPGDRITSNGISNAFRVTRNSAWIVAAAGRTPPSFHEIRSLSERLYREQYGAEFAQAMLGHKHATMTAKYDDMRGQGWQEVSAKGF